MTSKRTSIIKSFEEKDFELFYRFDQTEKLVKEKLFPSPVRLWLQHQNKTHL